MPFAAFRHLALATLLLGVAAVPALAQQPASATAASTPASQAEGIIREISEAVGVQPHFELRATTLVDNAAAVVHEGRRFLLYNPKFLAAVNRAGHTDWAGISILAHEMGHHLNGHTLRGGGSQPQDELEADEFSGFVLRRLGASLAEAQAALAAVAPEQGSASHPGRTPRLAAIGRGWARAQLQIAATATPGAAQPSAAPAALPTPPPAASVSPNAYVFTPASQAAATAAKPVKLVGQLTFRDNPGTPYYLTNQLNLVRLPNPDDGSPSPLVEAEVVGHLRRTGDSTFPFILEDSQQHHLFVTPRGDVYNQQGQRVAKLN